MVVIQLRQPAWVVTNAVVFPWMELERDGMKIEPLRLARLEHFQAVYLSAGVHEIHVALEGEEDEEGGAPRAQAAGFAGVLVQIALIDIVFSLDSVITAVGLADQVAVMVLAIVISVAVMMVAAKPIGEFVDAHPTIKMLALAFLVLVGVTLIAEGFDAHVPKGYIYFAMAFSIAVESLNIRLRGKRRGRAPVKLRRQHLD